MVLALTVCGIVVALVVLSPVLAVIALAVRLDLQLLHQSVPGGGYQDSEYPVMIDVFYTDVYGKDLHWYHNFYFYDLPPGSNWKQPTGERLPVGAWYTFESPNLLEELRSISDEWLTTMHGAEKKFSLGWFDDDYIRSSSIGAVHGPEGWITAFANFVPEYQLNEITIDLMRHRKEIENGTMEFMFVSLFRWAKAQGYAGFGLGLSALSGIGEKPADPAIERALRYVFEHINQFYNFKGLHGYKDKYGPVWTPRYLIYPSIETLPAVGAALIRANTGGDLLGGYLFHPQ